MPKPRLRSMCVCAFALCSAFAGVLAILACSMTGCLSDRMTMPDELERAEAAKEIDEANERASTRDSSQEAFEEVETAKLFCKHVVLNYLQAVEDMEKLATEENKRIQECHTQKEIEDVLRPLWDRRSQLMKEMIMDCHYSSECILESIRTLAELAGEIDAEAESKRGEATRIDEELLPRAAQDIIRLQEELKVKCEALEESPDDASVRDEVRKLTAQVKRGIALHESLSKRSVLYRLWAERLMKTVWTTRQFTRKMWDVLSSLDYIAAVLEAEADDAEWRGSAVPLVWVPRAEEELREAAEEMEAALADIAVLLDNTIVEPIEPEPISLPRTSCGDLIDWKP